LITILYPQNDVEISNLYYYGSITNFNVEPITTLKTKTTKIYNIFNSFGVSNPTNDISISCGDAKNILKEIYNSNLTEEQESNLSLWELSSLMSRDL
jgi:hypothetical protein